MDVPFRELWRGGVLSWELVGSLEDGWMENRHGRGIFYVAPFLIWMGLLC